MFARQLPGLAPYQQSTGARSWWPDFDAFCHLLSRPAEWPTQPILVMGRPWRGGMAHGYMTHETAYLFVGDYGATKATALRAVGPTDGFALWPLGIEDLRGDRLFPPDGWPKSLRRAVPSYLYPSAALLADEGWRILQQIAMDDRVVVLFECPA